jgi:hypothetical protein
MPPPQVEMRSLPPRVGRRLQLGNGDPFEMSGRVYGQGTSRVGLPVEILALILKARRWRLAPARMQTLHHLLR